MTYNKTNWVNNTNPPISAENLNKIENELESLDSDINIIENQLEIISTEKAYFEAYYHGTAGDVSFTTTVIWNNVIKDNYGGYNLSNGVYTCPNKGLYLVTIQYFSNSPVVTTARPTIFHNSSSNADTIQVCTNAAGSHAGLFSCEIGDTLYFGPFSSNYAIAFYGQRQHNRICIAQVL